MKKTETKKAAAKRFTADIKITAYENGKKITEKKTTTWSGMWKINKAIFAEHPTTKITIKKDGATFMKLHLQTKSNGKTWMVNEIADSRRGHQPKAEEPAQEIHTIAEAEPAAEEQAVAQAE